LGLSKAEECVACSRIPEVPIEISKSQHKNQVVLKHLNLNSISKVTPEEKRRFLARRAQETEQRRAIFNADTDAEET